MAALTGCGVGLFKATVLQSLGKVDLAPDLDETTGGIEILADDVGGHGLDLGHLQSAFPKVVQGMMDEASAESQSARLLDHGKVWDEARGVYLIDPCGDVAEDHTITLRHEAASWIGGAVFVDVIRLALLPRAAVPDAEPILQHLIQGDTAEGVHSDLSQVVQIIVTIMADSDRRFGRHGGADHNEAQPVFHPFLS